MLIKEFKELKEINWEEYIPRLKKVFSPMSVDALDFADEELYPTIVPKLLELEMSEIGELARALNSMDKLTDDTEI